MARELIILPRFKRDYLSARKHPQFESETLEYVFDILISGGALPEAFREHRLDKRSTNWVGLKECHVGADLLIFYRVRRDDVTNIGSSTAVVALIQRHDAFPSDYHSGIIRT